LSIAGNAETDQKNEVTESVYESMSVIFYFCIYQKNPENPGFFL